MMWVEVKKQRRFNNRNAIKKQNLFIIGGKNNIITNATEDHKVLNEVGKELLLVTSYPSTQNTGKGQTHLF